MTRHKTISSLSIAAIALFAAASTQAQTEPSDKNASVTSATVVEQTIASNLESSVARKSRATPEVEPVVKNAARTTLVLSASAFKGRNHFTSAARTSSFVNQVNFKSAGPVDPGAKKQFRADESEISRTKDVAFVPSKGQKLPE
jgi:hypothetical protein